MTTFGTYNADRNFNRNLRLGSNGADVAEMQILLKQQRYNIGTAGVDGKLGKNTLAAWKAFEEKHSGFIADGFATKNELKLMRAIVKHESATPAKSSAASTGYNNRQETSLTDSKATILTNHNAPVLGSNEVKGFIYTKTFVIDVGHDGFGEDKGCEAMIDGVKVYERDRVYAVVRELQNTIEEFNNKNKNSAIKLIVSNGKDKCQHDRYRNLKERANVADQYNADGFLSLHVDSRPKGSYTGPAVWVSNAGKNNPLQKALTYQGITTKVNNFTVLTENDYERPAVLIELGDIRETRLSDKNYQIELAKTIAAGIISFAPQKSSYSSS